MIAGSAWVMLLSTLRDRAALAMSFVLPPLLFMIFAAVFSGTSGADLKIKIGVIDEARTDNSARLLKALGDERNLRFILIGSGGERAVSDFVRGGLADVGLVIRGDPGRRPDEGPPPLLLIEDSTRPLASSIAVGQIMRTLNEKLPDVALARILADVEASGAIGKDEREFLDEAFRTRAAEGGAFSFAEILERTRIDQLRNAQNGAVLNYAGAVVAIFLLFAGVHGALTLLDERDNGIANRINSTGVPFNPSAFGKLAFLSVQGAIQGCIVFGTAYIFYDSSFDRERFVPWLITCFLAAAAASGLALLMCSICKSRKQAETFTTFAVLLMSAIGGSMVPRYLMPPWLQDIGWITPNTWIIRAFEIAVQPAVELGEVAVTWAVLLAIAVLGSVVATWLSSRRVAY